MSKRQLGVALDVFMTKEQRQAINENGKETLGRQHKRPIKRKKVEYKDEQEGGPNFMITTAASVQEVCVVEGDRARERDEAEDNGNRYKRQAAANREKKNKTEIIRETVLGRRRMLLLLQALREDAAAAVVTIATRLAIRDPGK